MTIPNILTLLRIILVPFVYLAISYYEPNQDHLRWAALSIFAIASLTDALDGFIVRKWNQRSNIGTFLDPVADKLLLISTYLSIQFSKLPLKPPEWVVVAIVFREIIILGGLTVISLTSHKVTVRPNLLGKATTFFQMISVVFILLQLPVARPLWLIAVLLTVISCFVYMSREMTQLHEPKTRK